MAILMLLKAYGKTAFNVDTPRGPLSLRIGQRCLELDSLMAYHGVSRWAYVTAFNPGSIGLSDTENAARQGELHAAVAALGFSLYRGEGAPDDGRWLPEPSLLIVGIGRRDATHLGREFGQVAILYGELRREAEL